MFKNNLEYKIKNKIEDINNQILFYEINFAIIFLLLVFQLPNPFIIGYIGVLLILLFLAKKPKNKI